MSHFTKVKTKMRDLVALKKALDDLGYTYTESESGEAFVKGYQGDSTTAALSIHASRTYDIGVQIGENEVELVADWWGVETTRGVTEEEFVKSLKQRYTYHKVMSELEGRGYTVVSEEVDGEEHIRIRVRSWE